ncbi:MAG TPA: hypothetical protein VFH76_01805 [Kribbella sp.]|jgi:hypothetical protein|nr:hypothetical protein [Kribbella sp.]
MCNLPPEVRAALYGVGQQDDDAVPDAEKPVGAEEPVGHYLVHE